MLLVAAPADAAPVRRPRVLFVGDSLLVEASSFVRALGAEGGAEVEVDAAGGTAICDWLGKAPAIRSRFRPTVVVMAFSGNSLTPCMKDVHGDLPWGSGLGVRYYTDVERMTKIFAGTGPILWVSPPAPKYWNTSKQAVIGAYDDATRWLGNAKVVDGGALISPGRVWSATQTCLYWERCTGPKRTNVVRSPDGLHFCPVGYEKGACPVYSSGAYRYALTMTGPALRQAGL